MDEIDLGKLILVDDVIDPQGNPAGEHTVICLTTKDEYALGSQVEAVVVLSKLHYTTKDCMVIMPSANGGHPQTGFDRKCAAICCWVVKVKEKNILRYGNRIYGSLLRQVLECVAKVQAEKQKAKGSRHS